MFLECHDVGRRMHPLLKMSEIIADGCDVSYYRYRSLCFTEVSQMCHIEINCISSLPAAAFIILLSHTCGRWTFAPMERLVVVYHFVISIVEGEGVLLVSFSHADFLSWNQSDLVCWKKGARYEISCGDPSEKSLLCCRNWTIIYPGNKWWELFRKCKLKFILLIKTCTQTLDWTRIIKRFMETEKLFSGAAEPYCSFCCEK